MQPVLCSWLEGNQDRAASLTDAERDELFSLFGVGGPLTEEGVEHFVRMLERRRSLMDKVAILAGCEESLEFMEQMVGFLMEAAQPYREER